MSKSKEYCYYIPFLHEKGHGSCTIIQKKKIKSYSDLADISANIESKNGVSKVVVLSWNLLPLE